MQGLIGDVRQAFRVLRARPGFSLAAVLTLALGIGGSTAIFSLTSAILLAQPPLRDPDGLVFLWENASRIGFPRNDVSPALYAAVRDQARSFEDVTAIAAEAFTLTGDGEPLKVEGRRVPPSFFTVLGVPPARGRVIEAGDETAGAKVAVISHGLWHRRFGGDARIVGRDVLMNGEKHTVIGVMPRDFQFLESYVAVWVPAAFPAEELESQARYLTLVARLKPGVTEAAAEAELGPIAARVAQRFGAEAFPVYLRPLREQLVGEARRPLMVLALGITFVLLITCANVAGLLVARTAARGRELAVRSARGHARPDRRPAPRRELVAGRGGGVLALAVAAAVLASLQELVPPGLVLAVHPTLDGRAIGLALTLSAVTGVLFGLAPAVGATRRDLSAALHAGARGLADAGPQRLRAGLVIGELAATLTLLVGAGLLGQTLYRLRYADLGLRPERVADRAHRASPLEVPRPAEARRILRGGARPRP